MIIVDKPLCTYAVFYWDKEKIMVDVYTKAVLTVIAVALSVVAIRSAVPSALAIGDGCGRISDPCYITTVLPIRVIIR